MATIIVSDPAIRVRSSGGTFSSAGASAAQTPRTTVRPSAPATPAIPIPPTKTGYGTPAESTFSSAAPQPPAPPVSTPSEKTYSSDPPLPTPILPKYYPPTYPTDTPPKEYATLPYVYSVTINNITEGSGGGSTPGGATGDIQFNSGNTLAGDSGLTFDPTLDKLTVTGNVAANGIVTDNLYYSNGNPWVFASAYGNSNVAAYLVSYSGLLSGTLTTAAQPNITSVGTLTSLNVSGNITAGNINTTGTVTFGTANVTGNISVGGILTDHLYYANGMPRSTGGGGGGALSISPETFRGTDSQTNFTLAVDPMGINNTQVYIFGVYQQKSTYTVTGTLLSFSQAPPAPLPGQPDNIEVLIYSLV